MKKTAVVFYHDSPEDPGLFGQILKDRGFALRLIDTRKEDIKNLDPLACGLLMVMGGPMAVYEADRYPYLYDEISAMELGIAAGRPMLGVCLGSQLMAKALDKKVYKGAASEFGWHKLDLSEAGKNHPARHFDSAKTLMFQSHEDTFDLPERALLLASSDKYKNQIYSYGKNAIAMQCHPEVTPDLLNGWLPADSWL